MECVLLMRSQVQEEEALQLVDSIEVKPDVAEQLVQLGDAKTGFLRYSSLLQHI